MWFFVSIDSGYKLRFITLAYAWSVNFRIITILSPFRGPGQRSRYSDLLWAGRYGDRIPVSARFSASFQTGPRAHTVSYTLDTGSFPGVTGPGRGVEHPPPDNTGVKERVKIYLYSSRPSWPALGKFFLFNFTFYISLFMFCLGLRLVSKWGLDNQFWSKNLNEGVRAYV